MEIENSQHGQAALSVLPEDYGLQTNRGYPRAVQRRRVAVSDYVFHRFPVDLLIQVSANQLSLFLYIVSVFMANDRTFEDAIHTSLPGSPTPLSSNVGFPYGTGSRAITMEEKINEINLQLPLLLQDPPLSALSHARRRDPCPSRGRCHQQEDSTNLVLRCREKIQMVNILEMRVLLPRIDAGDATAFDALLGIRDGFLDPLLPHNFPGKNHTYFSRLTKNNDIVCIQEIHGKDEFLQAIQVLAPQFRLQADRRSAFIRISFLKEQW